MNKLNMPTDEMVEKTMTPQAREAYRDRMRHWRERGEDEPTEEELES